MKQTTRRSLIRHLCIIACAAVLGWCASASAESNEVRFGVEAWPGLTVKTEVAAELLQSIGYQTEQKSMNTPFVAHSLTHGDIDVALGLWYPLTADLIDPLVKQGKIIKLTANLTDAVSGLAVPEYVHRAGVNTVADLNRYAGRFNHKIYGIGAGTTYNQYVNKAIKNNVYDLGDWHLVSSSVAAMLAEVKRRVDDKQWIVFYAWQPHWMNTVYKLYYLKLPKGVKHQAKPIIDVKATVYTVVSANFPKTHPNLTRFFKQFKVGTSTQSQWIYKYGKQKEDKKKIAREWIRTHPAIVRGYLKGVDTSDGKPAFPVVEKAFDMQSTS